MQTKKLLLSILSISLLTGTFANVEAMKQALKKSTRFFSSFKKTVPPISQSNSFEQINTEKNYDDIDPFEEVYSFQAKPIDAQKLKRDFVKSKITNFSNVDYINERFEIAAEIGDQDTLKSIIKNHEKELNPESILYAINHANKIGDKYIKEQILTILAKFIKEISKESDI